MTCPRQLQPLLHARPQVVTRAPFRCIALLALQTIFWGIWKLVEPFIDR